MKGRGRGVEYEETRDERIFYLHMDENQNLCDKITLNKFAMIFSRRLRNQQKYFSRISCRLLTPVRLTRST